MTTNQPTNPSSQTRLFPGLVLALLIANLGGLAFLAVESRTNDNAVQGRLDELRRAFKALHYQTTSQYPGSGFLALLDHLQYWAPWLQKGKPGTEDRFFVANRIDDIVETMSFLPDAFRQIETAFLDEQNVGGDATTNDELRKWLLVAALTADPEKGRDLLARILTGEEFQVSLRLRRFAAGELLQADKKRAGEVLHELLNAEGNSATRRPGSQTRGLHPKQLFNYIDDYVASGHPGVEATLVRMLKRTENYETITVQRCVEALGTLKSKMAVSTIKKLYLQQSPVPGQVPNPLFRRKCMIAIVEALGQDAVPFLKEIDKTETDHGIRAKLNEYKKQFDFSEK